jgi:hypothetical protein
MIAAEIEVGRIVADIGVERADELARAVGVRRSVLINAAMQARGLVRRHRRLERAASERARRAMR